MQAIRVTLEIVSTVAEAPAERGRVGREGPQWAEEADRGAAASPAEHSHTVRGTAGQEEDRGPDGKARRGHEGPKDRAHSAVRAATNEAGHTTKGRINGDRVPRPTSFQLK